jgi:hypothetical protein
MVDRYPLDWVGGGGSGVSTYLSTECLPGISIEMSLQRDSRVHVVHFGNLVLCVTGCVRVFETQLTVSNSHCVHL